MRRDDAADDPRRRVLVRALSLGVLLGGAGWSRTALAQVFGKRPGQLPEGRSIFELRGEVTVDGKRADENTLVRPTATVRTGEGSYVIYAVGANAYLLRERSALELGGGNPLKQALRLLTGKMLGVFGKRGPRESLALTTPTATIGIRGTGLYAEADPEKTYLCTCYGTTQFSAAGGEQEQVTTTHHDAARWILRDPVGGKRITPAPFINHTDLELMTLEALVGRKVPFGLPDSYQGPRRDY